MTESEKVFEEWFEDIYQKDALSLEAGKLYEGLISKDLAWSAWSAALLWASEQKLGELVRAIKLDGEIVEVSCPSEERYPPSITITTNSDPVLTIPDYNLIDESEVK